MSVSYIWVCDAVKQYIDPYPLTAPHVYVWMQVYLDDDGTRGWSGESIRLISDSGDQDEYYLRTIHSRNSQYRIQQLKAWGGTEADIYQDVTERAMSMARKFYPDLDF